MTMLVAGLGELKKIQSGETIAADSSYFSACKPSFGLNSNPLAMIRVPASNTAQTHETCRSTAEATDA